MVSGIDDCKESLGDGTRSIPKRCDSTVTDKKKKQPMKKRTVGIFRQQQQQQFDFSNSP
jgi:hypothetical protein